jgi:diaminopimelate epimerase
VTRRRPPGLAGALAAAGLLGYMPRMDGTRDDGRKNGRVGGHDGLAFRKMHGAGNDFVIIDQRRREVALTPALVRAIGDRHRGVGFDQLAEILPGGNTTAAVRFWNADGGGAQACGNATRCIADLLIAETGLSQVTLGSQNGVLIGRRRADGLVEVDMGLPRWGWRDVPLAREADTLRLPIEGGPAACSMGNPHCTLFVDDAEAVALAARGPQIEHDPLFPERTNVQLVEVQARDRARVRVWERGVGETLASGSSSCAVLVNAVRRGLMDRRATMVLDGGALQIEWREDGHVLMAGPVAHVFEGTLSADFLTAAELA